MIWKVNKHVTFIASVILLLGFTVVLANSIKEDHPYSEPNITADPEEVICLALNIYHEARNDNLAGKAAVADVVLNRTMDARYPDTICDVVYQGKRSRWWAERGEDVPVRNMCQFSWFCDGQDDTPRNEVAWQEAKLIANSFLSYGHYRGITEGATHYHATYVSPNWIYDRGMHLIGRIGDHIFYRWQ